MSEQRNGSEMITVAPELLIPIPLEVPSVAGWKEVPLEPTDSDDLVPLGLFAPEFGDIHTSSTYYGERDDSPYRFDELSGTNTAIFVRRGVAERMVQAQSLLPENLRLVVYDAYRPLEVQQALYDKYIGGLKALHPDWTAEQLATETQKFVSIPSTDSTKPSPHNTGGSIDLAIAKVSDWTAEGFKQMGTETPDKRAGQELWSLIQNGKATLGFPYEHGTALPENVAKWVAVQLEREHGVFRDKTTAMLDFGTPFDYGTPDGKADPNYFERLEQERPLAIDEITARDNRRILYNVMAQVDMQPLDSEWWHYNSPESQMGAKAAGLTVATYGAIALSKGNKLFADAKNSFDRRNHFIQRASHLARAAIITPVA